jgi:hypothetical protein
MNKDNKYYKFVNSETDNTIFFFSFLKSEQYPKMLLEKIRQKLAYEKAMSVDHIYYAQSDESDFDE